MYIKIALALALMLLPVGTVPAQNSFNDLLRRQAGEPAPPRLISPVTETTPYPDTPSIEFRWENSAIDVRYFEFRLYRGYDLYARNLVLKKTIPGSASTFSLPAATCVPGQPYSWSLVRVNLDGRKSEKVYAVFSIAGGVNRDKQGGTHD